MAKRSNFPRRDKDTYDTPYGPVMALLPHLAPSTRYREPCAGKGDLIRHLATHGHECVAASDIAPRARGIKKIDALELDFGTVANCIITNPPWKRTLLHPMIARFSWIAPTWLLFDADWAHTQQAQPYLKYCQKIVSVGRVQWIEGSKNTGKDNAAWYLFDRQHIGNPVFYNQHKEKTKC